MRRIYGSIDAHARHLRRAASELNADLSCFDAFGVDGQVNLEAVRVALAAWGGDGTE